MKTYKEMIKEVLKEAVHNQPFYYSVLCQPTGPEQDAPLRWTVRREKDGKLMMKWTNKKEEAIKKIESLMSSEKEGKSTGKRF